jgi:lipoteichoic acid synthase
MLDRPKRSPRRVKNHCAPLCYLVSLFLIFGIVYVFSFDLGINSLGIVGLTTFFSAFIAESFLVMTISLVLTGKGLVARIMIYLIGLVYAFINSTQLIFVNVSGRFISRLAIENADHIALALTPQLIVYIVVTFFICLAPAIFTQLHIQRYPHFSSGIKWGCAVIAVFFMSVHVLMAEAESPAHNSVAEVLKKNALRRNAPLWEFFSILQHSDADMPGGELDPSLLSSLRMSYNEGKAYPIKKPFITTSPPPFSLKDKSKKDRPNIILFFVEGFAARATSVYSDKFPLMTPHLLDFSQSSMVVTNYYSHTAATYRGVHGQLCSLYPYFGGNGGWHTNYDDMPKTNYRCVQHVLKKRGYRTVFLNSERAGHTFLDELMLRIGFDDVLTAEKLSKLFLDGEEPVRSDALGDIQLARALTGYLKKQEYSDVEAPFFMSIYNLETHAWQDTQENGIKYRDGKNNALNTIYNFDKAFGVFWDYFKLSKWAKNTVIVFTSDHARFPEKSFIDAIHEAKQMDYQPIFVDRIPLIIFDASRDLLKTYDAQWRSSIDLAPTMLHYLGYQDIPNSFIGTSIFDKAAHRGSLASIGDLDYWIEPDQITPSNQLNNLSKKKRVLFNNARLFIRKTQQLELANQLWPDPLNGKPVDELRSR